MLAEIDDDYEEELDGLAVLMDKFIEILAMLFLGSIVGFFIDDPSVSLRDVILAK